MASEGYGGELNKAIFVDAVFNNVYSYSFVSKCNIDDCDNGEANEYTEKNKKETLETQKCNFFGFIYFFWKRNNYQSYQKSDYGNFNTKCIEIIKQTQNPAKSSQNE